MPHYILRSIPDPLWDKAKRRAKLDGGRRMRHVLLDLIKYYVAYGLPPFEKVTRQKRQRKSTLS
jgi:hypothetical protein